MKASEFIIGNFNDTGINNINVQLVAEKWNHLWCISQYGATFRLIKGVRKDSPMTSFKTEISAKQADELIEKLGLGQEKSGIFMKASTWKK